MNVINDFTEEIVSGNSLNGPVPVTFQNLSTLSAADQHSIQQEILAKLRTLGVRPVKTEPSATEIQVVFSEDWQNLVWVAEIKQNGGSRLVIKKFPHAQKASTQRISSVTLQKTFVWSQDTPILDFILDGKTLLLLEPEQISLHVSDSGEWKTTAALSISHESPWPRDLRGRLEGSAQKFTAFLPGLRCAGTVAPPELTCRASDDPWQLDHGQLEAFFSPARNFFTGVLSGQNAGFVPAFFSATTWREGDAQRLLFAGNDGRARLYESNLTSPAATFNDWGSDVVAIHSGCGPGWQLLVSSSSTAGPDSLRAMEIMSREALPVSPVLELTGAIRALWPDGSGSQAANLVLKPAARKYEAFALTISCNQ